MSKRKRITHIVFIVILVSITQLWLCLVHFPYSNNHRFSSSLEIPKQVRNVHINRLRRDWTTRPYDYLSPLAKQLYDHQHNCTLPMAQFWFRNRFGLGSDLHVWSQAACNALQHQVRIRTIGPWIWLNHLNCTIANTSTTAATAAASTIFSSSAIWNSMNDPYHHSHTSSTMACYFPFAEPNCPITNSNFWVNHNLTKGRGILTDNACRDFRHQHNITVSTWRAAATEYLFSSVSPDLQEEANRQLNHVFPNGIIPKNLITVHIRWGDKEDEMKLVPVLDYIDAVKQLIQDPNEVHVYLSTSDPQAVYEFVSSSPPEWNIYIDAYFQEYYKSLQQQSPTQQQQQQKPFSLSSEYNRNPHLSLDHDGKPGFIALASLLVALEANDFVLTTSSNWSRLLNELRQTILNAECNSCTRMIDLRPGEW